MAPTRIDPDQTGTWTITTLSGAVYLLSIPPDGRATVSRRPPRRDPTWRSRNRGEPTHTTTELLVGWGAYDALHGISEGINLGECAVWLVEPLDTLGNARAHITTPVAMIERP